MSNCYADENAHLQPTMRLVTVITKDSPASVTTSFDHGYSSGLKVRFYIPSYYGMTQLDEQIGSITVTGSDTFTVDIDTRKFDTFAAPVAAWYQNRCALVIPVTGTVQDIT